MIFPELPDGYEPSDPDLPDGTVAIGTADWFDLILRLSIHPSLVAVAAPLARHANPDGTKTYPGAPKVGNMGGLSSSRVRDIIAFFIEQRLLVVKKRGGGRPRRDGSKPPPTEYRLTRPADLTALGMRLDPRFNPVPDGEGFEPLQDTELHAPTGAESGPGPGKHRAPTRREAAPKNVKQRQSTRAESGTPDTEHRAPTGAENKPDPTEHSAPVGADSTETPRADAHEPAELSAPVSADTPVDNSARPETPPTPDGNSARFYPKLSASARRDLVVPINPDLTPPWSSQATDLRGTPPSRIASAALDGEDTIGPVDFAAELAAARIILAASGDAAHWRAAARRALAERGRHHPGDQLVTVVAGELCRRAPSDHAHPDQTIMNGDS